MAPKQASSSLKRCPTIRTSRQTSGSCKKRPSTASSDLCKKNTIAGSDGNAERNIFERLRCAEAQVDKIEKQAACVRISLALAKERELILADRLLSLTSGFDDALANTCAARYRAERAELQRSGHKDALLTMFHSVISSLSRGGVSMKSLESLRSLAAAPAKREMLIDASSSSAVPSTPTLSASKNVFLAAVSKSNETVSRAQCSSSTPVKRVDEKRTKSVDDLISSDASFQQWLEGDVQVSAWTPDGVAKRKQAAKSKLQKVSTPIKRVDEKRVKSVGDLIGSDELFQQWLERDVQVSASTPEGFAKGKQAAKAKSQKGF